MHPKRFIERCWTVVETPSPSINSWGTYARSPSRELPYLEKRDILDFSELNIGGDF